MFKNIINSAKKAKVLYEKVILNLKRFINEPVDSVLLLRAILRGSFYVVYYRFFKRNIKIGHPFIAYNRVRIIGPGSVSIGKRCTVFENVFRGLTIVTLSEDASVTIGQRCSLGGLTVRCRERVEIGDDVMTAVSLVQDSLFVNMLEAETKVTKKQVVSPSKSIVIGDNVWLGMHNYVLNGSKIGNDCVLAAGSLYCGIEIKDYSLGSGNPVKRALPIAQLLALRK